MRGFILYLITAAMIALVGWMQSWNTALLILNMGMISAIMALGVNMQWGYAGLFNIGIMGFVAMGGLATVLVSMPPVIEAWTEGGFRMIVAIEVGILTVFCGIVAWNKLPRGRPRVMTMLVVLVGGFFFYRWLFDPAVDAIESINPTIEGYLGGLGLPVLLSWPVGGVLAAGAAWVVGKTALGLRSDYLAIATLGIAEIIIAV
ncbi:MAG: branched-chain amino acid ABC transporter permease, partial [Pseudooceanicola sp.]|nr:branched-chain amino acid ABC transporter permease [Pseudooceanicola sp.]